MSGKPTEFKPQERRIMRGSSFDSLAADAKASASKKMKALRVLGGVALCGTLAAATALASPFGDAVPLRVACGAALIALAGFAIHGWRAHLIGAVRLEAAYGKMRYQSGRDRLTGLAGPVAFGEKFDSWLEGLRERNSQGFLALIDFPQLAALNKEKGSAFGDGALRALASRLSSSAGLEGAAARIGADRFALLVDAGTKGTDEARTVAERFFASCSQPLDGGVELRARAGFSRFPLDGQSRQELEHKALLALDLAAKSSAAHYMFYEPFMSSMNGEDSIGFKELLGMLLARQVDVSELHLSHADASIVSWGIYGNHPETGDAISSAEIAELSSRCGLGAEYASCLLDAAANRLSESDPSELAGRRIWLGSGAFGAELLANPFLLALAERAAQCGASIGVLVDAPAIDKLNISNSIDLFNFKKSGGLLGCSGLGKKYGPGFCSGRGVTLCVLDPDLSMSKFNEAKFIEVLLSELRKDGIDGVIPAVNTLADYERARSVFAGAHLSGLAVEQLRRQSK